MKKVIIRIAVLVLVFAASVFGIGKFINRGTPDSTGEMSSATLPLVYMNVEDTQLNCLHGYKKEMDVTTMRDSLTPVDDNRELKIQIQPYQNKINGVSFEVISSDGKTSLENTKVTKLEQDENYVNATLKFQNKILINKEYMLKIQVNTGSKDVFYYTRIIQQDGLNTKAYLDFAVGFYEKSLNGNDTAIGESLEPDATTDNTTLHFVDIHSDANQVIWADMNPQVYYKPTPTIKELNATTATIVMNYMVSTQNEDKKTEHYNVSEYYRLRYTEARVYLLDFERTTEEIFNPENNVIQETGIKLGISDKDIEYKNDSQNQYFAFVREGALWLYEVSSNKMVQVFSFPQETNSDSRDTYDQNEIQIIDIDSMGNMYFLVCGYMNRGSHEGEAGVAIYSYDNQTSAINERLFVETKQSFALLQQDLESLAYVTEDREKFYMLLDRQVYGIDMNTRQVETVVSDTKVGCYAGPGSGKYFAWLDENEAYNSRTINVINLDTQEKQTITCGKNERIRPLGFMDQDLIYGVADIGDINTEHEGNERFPMKKILIVNGQGETVKEYAPDGVYVMDTVVQEKLLTLKRAIKNGDAFEETTEDHIVNSVPDEENSYGIATVFTERKQTETVLRVGGTLKAGTSPEVVRSKQVLYEGSRKIILDPQENDEEIYYVYAKGRLDGIYTSPSIAVSRADETLGIVVDKDQQNIWERGNKKTKLDLDVTRFPEVMLQYNLDVEFLKSSIGKTVLDLSGCTLDMVLYFVSEGYPVLAKTPEGAVIIGGYDEYNTRLLYPGKEELEYYGMDDSAEMFEEAGNIFMTYIDPVE